MDGQETDTGERVELAESAKPAAPEKDTRTLKQRLAAIRDECAGIGKQDIQMEKDGKRWTIKGHTFEAILSELRPLFAKHGVDVTPNLAERSYTGNRCDVLVDFTFTRTDDSDEQTVIRWGGAGTDNGDKAFAKAGTNAVKEMLKKRFLVTDRDDAKEETESVEHMTDEAVSRAAAEQAKEQARANLQQWATTFKAAVESAPDLKALTRLERDNKDQLTSADLPSVTRAFFAEAIANRKKELAE